MPLRRLHGYDESLGTPNYLAEPDDYHLVVDQVSVAGGIGKELRVYRNPSTGAAAVKAHIHASNGGLLRDFSSGGDLELASTGWNAFSISDLEITDSTIYRLSLVAEVDNLIGGYYGGEATGQEYYQPSSFSSHTAPDPLDTSGWGSDDPYDLGIAVWGYIPPTISSDDRSGVLGATDTDVTLFGADLEAAQGDGKVYLSDNATWGLGTVVEQTNVTTWTDAFVIFNVTPGTLQTGPVYAWVETDSGQHNAVGHSFSFTAVSGDVEATGAGQSPTIGQGTGSASAPIDATGAGQTPAIDQGTAAAQVGSDVEATGAGQTPTVDQGTGSASAPVSATGAGQSPTVDQGTAAAQAGVSTGPVAEYLFNEAASGAGTGTVEDQRPNAADLTITYDSSEPVYDTDTGGRLLDFGDDHTAESRLRANHGPVTTGHKVHTALHGSKKVTWELVYRLPPTQNDYRRGFPLMMACQKDFEGVENGIYGYAGHYDVNSGDTLQISFNSIGTVDYHTDPTTFYEHYFNRNVKLDDAPPYGGGTNENFYETSERTIVVHFVVDTTQPNAIDRIQLWIDGTRYALDSWNGYDHPTAPLFHGGQDVPLNAEIHLTPFSSGTGNYEVQISVGCESYPNGGTPRGQVGYGAVYDRAFGATEIGARATALAADHDSAWVGNVDVTGAGQAPTVNQGVGSASAPIDATGAGQEVGESQGDAGVTAPIDVTGAGQTASTDQGDADTAAPIDVTGAGQTASTDQGDADTAAPIDVTGAGQTASTDQGDADTAAPIDVTGAGQTATVTPGSAAAQAGGAVAAVGAGQSPTVDQGVASLPVNATGAGQTASTDQGDADTAAPIDVTGAGQSASIDQGDAGVSISGPVEATGVGQTPTVGQGAASASIRDSVWGNVSEIDGVDVQNIESIMGIASQNIDEIDGVAV
jgi:hypothetical protein